MKLDAFLNKRVFIALIIFLLAALTAFWPGYFGRILAPLDSHLHRHGIAMTLWCVMLIAQALLIRSRQQATHRLVGKLSYVLVPVMAFTSFDLVIHSFVGTAELQIYHFYFIALSVNSILAFLLIYALAIYYRKNAAMHARFMISTIFPLFTPITDRLIFRFFRELIPYAPRIGNSPIVPFFGFALAELFLLILILWDWKSTRKPYAFLSAFGITFIYHFSVMHFYEYGFWQSFCRWFLQLPF